MRTLDRIATAIRLLLGVGHRGAAPACAPGPTPGAAWLWGAGLTLVFLAFLHGCRLASPEAFHRLSRLCLAANLLALASQFGHEVDAKDLGATP